MQVIKLIVIKNIFLVVFFKIEKKNQKSKNGYIYTITVFCCFKFEFFILLNYVENNDGNLKLSSNTQIGFFYPWNTFQNNLGYFEL